MVVRRVPVAVVVICTALWWCVVAVPGSAFSHSRASICPSPATSEVHGLRPTAPALKLKKLQIGPASFYVWDTSIVAWVMDGRAAEGKVLNVFRTVLEQNRESGDVVDIGANSGIYGIYAATLGYTTYLVDLQPTCQQYLNASIWINRLEAHARLVPRAIGRDGSTTLRVSPRTPCVGHLRASTSAEFEKLTAGVDPNSFYNISTVRFDDVYEGESIALVKIDTEGFEAEVLAGMTRLLRERRVKHIAVEVTPRFWREFGMDRARVAEELAALWDYGFTKATMFANAGESISDRTFASKAELLSVLQNENFVQRDFYFSSV